jgi:hypothetical protein
MDSIINIITPATTFDLMSLEEMKEALKIPDTDTSQDAQLQNQITVMSDVIATECNRCFAKEEVQETWRDLDSRRVYLSHWPTKAADITAVECPRGTPYDPSQWELEVASGKLSLFAGQDEPISVTYTGGYLLPDDAPPALKAACEIMIRNYRLWIARQLTSGIRSLSHKEARVMFFDPNVLLKQTGGTPFGAAAQAVKDLLYHYMRIWV